MNNTEMKQLGMKMGLLMGTTIGFVNSLIGNLSSGRFTVSGFLISFLISFAVSQILGRIVPVRKISEQCLKKANARPGTGKGRVIEALVTTLVYSPIMTFVMILFAYLRARSHGVQLPFGPMLLRSECISIVSSFILSYLLSPIYLKLLTKQK